MDDSGAFVVAWNSAGQDSSGDGIFVRSFDSAGQGSVEGEMNTYYAGSQTRPALSMAGNIDNFLVVGTRS